MEIRMKTLMVGPSVARYPGETCVVSAEEGQMLVKGGYAEAIQALQAQPSLDPEPLPSPVENSEEQAIKNPKGKK